MVDVDNCAVNMINIYNIKGIKEIFIPEIYRFQNIVKTFDAIIYSYGYNEIKLPLLEKTFLFKKTLGKNSDIITKEMFSFYDKNKILLTLIPEGTTSCLKSLAVKGFLRNKQKIDVWYISPMFRREKPQKGRHRLFYQIGIESFGVKDYIKEIEHIIIIKKLFNKLNIETIILELNCLDNNTNYKNILYNFFNKHLINIKINKTINVLKLLDKNKIINNIQLPKSIDCLNRQIRYNFIKAIYTAAKCNISFTINHRLVRGLDYYDNIVYEWTSNINNKKLTICAGGRYNKLSYYLFKINTYCTGCAIGIERLSLLLSHCNKQPIKFKTLINNSKSIHINLKILEHIRINNNNKNLIYKNKN